jgi:hypothetical protein
MLETILFIGLVVFVIAHYKLHVSINQMKADIAAIAAKSYTEVKKL